MYHSFPDEQKADPLAQAPADVPSQPIEIESPAQPSPRRGRFYGALALALVAAAGAYQFAGGDEAKADAPPPPRSSCRSR